MVLLTIFKNQQKLPVFAQPQLNKKRLAYPGLSGLKICMAWLFNIQHHCKKPQYTNHC